MAVKHDIRVKSFRETIVLAVTVSLVTAFTLSALGAVRELPKLDESQLEILDERSIHQLLNDTLRVAPGPTAATTRGLLFYNRPPKTGSTSVRIAMKRALVDRGLVSARCFNMIEWNEMAMRTIINRRNVDFYGCHTRLSRDRYRDVADMRGGNVTFMTSTRRPSNIVFSSYLQHHRHRNVAGITDKEEMAAEIDRYKEYMSTYPVHALYNFHGADVPLTKCPYTFRHENAMRTVAERYEIVVDLERPEESAALVEIVTGLKVDFNIHYNERSSDLTKPMLAALAQVDTSSRDCGNELVHKVLSQQFNVIKDRLMQNRCFNEDNGTFELCDKTELRVSSVVERTRTETFKEKKKLIAM